MIPIWNCQLIFFKPSISWVFGKHYCPKNGFQSGCFRFCDFFLRMLFPLVTFRTLWIGLNRRETCRFKCFLASFNLFNVLQGSFQNEYWHILTFPTGKYRLILYYPGHTFHFPRATGKWNSRPLIPTKFRKHPSGGSEAKADYVFQYIYMHQSTPPPSFI